MTWSGKHGNLAHFYHLSNMAWMQHKVWENNPWRCVQSSLILGLRLQFLNKKSVLHTGGVEFERHGCLPGMEGLWQMLQWCIMGAVVSYFWLLTHSMVYKSEYLVIFFYTSVFRISTYVMDVHYLITGADPLHRVLTLVVFCPKWWIHYHSVKLFGISIWLQGT